MSGKVADGRHPQGEFPTGIRLSLGFRPGLVYRSVFKLKQAAIANLRSLITFLFLTSCHIDGYLFRISLYPRSFISLRAGMEAYFFFFLNHCTHFLPVCLAHRKPSVSLLSG